jgi:GTP cyclohydrolase III
MGNKLTLADFTKKATDKYNSRKMIIEIEVEGMDGTVMFTRPSQNDLLVYKSKNANAIKTEKGKNGKAQVAEMDFILMTEAAVELIYNSCTFLHDENLQKSLEVVDPYDIVTKVFGTDGTVDIANKISDAFSDEEVVEKIKN